jgi:ubiquinone biosynthesis protein
LFLSFPNLLVGFHRSRDRQVLITIDRRTRRDIHTDEGRAVKRSRVHPQVDVDLVQSHPPRKFQGLVAERVDRKRLLRDVADFLDRYASVPIGQVNVAALVGTLFEILQRHHVRVPSELLLIGKALATVDGMARDLDPTLDPIEAIRPYVLRTWLRRLSDPRFLARDWIELAGDTVTAATSFPRDVHAILTDLRRGELALRVRSEGLETLIRESSRSANRSALALLVGSATLGSAWLLASGAGPALGPLPITAWLGLAGLGLAGSGFWILAYGVLRSGRF